MKSEREMKTILAVDDAPATLEVLQRNLMAAGYRVFTAGDARQALDLLQQTPVDLIITDLKMPGITGLELVRHVRENVPDSEVMMITGYASVEGAVKAMKTGAEEYLAKPFTQEELLKAVHSALAKLQTRRAASAPPIVRPPHGLLGESDVMKKVFRAIGKAARSSATVFVAGESGTGKELVARAIHYSSARAAAPFVAVNCGAIPETLLESELFGYVKGAFTGADESRAGFFQTADGGTIFLDEVSETSPGMQVKLLRVLQDHEVSMLGATRTRKVDIRIIASTNRDAASIVSSGRLREDLFFRLNVVPVTLPPLRDRGDDVLLLAHHFAVRFSQEGGRTPPDFSEKALHAMREYYWPGNVRELQNLVQNLVVMGDGDVVDVSDLPPPMRFSALRDRGLDRPLWEVETEHIKSVLASVDGNRTKAARILGIDRKTLREKLKTTTTD